jgi:hypothetical protein
MGTGCSVGLACNGGTCTAPGQASVVLFGGCTGQLCGELFGDTYVLHGSTWTQIDAPLFPSARAWSSMSALAGRVVLFGGRTRTLLDDTWLFDSMTWTEVAVPTRPPARFGGCMATLGHQVVLFGGSGANAGVGPNLTDTWLFDGASWTEVSTSSPPPLFTNQAMATVGSQVVLVGEDYGNFEGHFETWTFDGSTWSTLGVPPLPRHLLVLSAASLGNSLVVFLGGAPKQGLAFENQTWMLDGSTWSQVATSSPTPDRASTTILSLDGQVLLVGGDLANTNALQPLTDLWTFEGSSWSTLGVSNAPVPRAFSTVAVLP